ncbi:MAG TPA: ABC transporter transmembrane domain-containing protein, partial [Synergistaceae bacterium]|nr:ABC transporter transmembrane domain-containing protein [Synergistaceae bacterium]
MKTPASCASRIHKKSISRKENFTKKSSVRKLYEVFTPRERMQAVVLFSAALITAFAQALGVFSIFPFINVVMNPESIQTNRWLSWGYTTLGFTKPGTFMIALGMATIATVVFSNVLSALTMWGKARFVLNKNHTLSKRLLEVYLSKPYEFFLLKNTSELAKNVLAEINALTNNFLMPLFDGAINILLLLVIVGMLFAVDPLVTAGALLFLGVTYGLLNFYTRAQLKKKGAQRLEANTKRFRAATEALSSIKITKVMGVEPYFLHHYASHSGTFARLNVFASVIGQLPYYIMEAVVFGGLLLFVVISLHGGEKVATIIPLVSLYAFAGKRMMPALQIIYLSVTQIYYNQAILDKVYQDMIEENLLGEPISFSGEAASEEDAAIAFQRELSLKDISFAYADSGKNVIDSLSLDIPKGSVIGFVGATGSGKTTLVDILLGLLIPQSGSILV